MFDVDHDGERAAALGTEVNGFSFEGMDAPGMDYALNRCELELLMYTYRLFATLLCLHGRPRHGPRAQQV